MYYPVSRYNTLYSVAAFIASLTIATADILITEVMSKNGHGLTDADGDSSDWIEIFNSGQDAATLAGHFLTDVPDSPTKWQLPAETLPSNGFLIVFASGKDRTDAAAELHTNFTLNGDATYVALSDTTGAALSEFDLADVAQFEDVSYGVAQTGNRTTSTLLASSSPTMVLVPTSDIGQSWTSPDFNDATWQSATTGIGYERGNGYASLIGANGDVESEMYETNGSVYFRVPFQAVDAVGITALTLRMKYDDGFAAFLNGVRVAEANAPTTLRWDSTSTGQHDDSAAVVFDDFDMTTFARELRTGANVLAIQGLNTNLTSSDLIFMPEVQVTRLTEATLGEPGYLSTATPGAFNSDSFGGFVSDTKFSIDRGFFTDPFTLEITTSSPDATIRYTTDGSDPSDTNGTRYSGPLTISQSTVLRAAAFQDELVPSNIDTHTYLFPDDVLRQSPNDEVPPGWPGDGEINGQEMRYGMSQRVVDIIHDPADVVAALKSVPTFSVVTPLENLFDPARGIYTNPGNDGRNWERPASVELLNPDGTTGFQVDAGIRIRGGFSRTTGNPKHAFRLFFRREYGDAKLRYPLFGDEGVDDFDNIDLRTSQNYSWGFQGDSRNLFLRDVFSRDLQGKMGHPYTRSRFYHLYLNGVYWGLFQTQERAEASFAESYLKADKEDFDVISKFGSTTDGNRDAYARLWQEATDGFTNERYFRVQGLNPDGSTNASYERLLDAGNVIDYMILTYHTGDRDGPGSRFTQPNPNNYFGIYNRENPDGFKFFEHDSEHSLDTGETNMVSPFTSGNSNSQFNPHWLHEQLMENEIYRQRFIDRVQESFFNDGLLTGENAVALLNSRASQIDQAIIAESARWGWLGRENDPFTRDTWLGAAESTRNWLLARVPTVIEQLRAVNWFPDTSAPDFVLAGGAVAPGFGLQFRSGSGTLYYTMDGSDPRQANGSINPLAAIAEPAREIATRMLDEDSPATAFVPTSDSLGTNWRDSSFNDTSWKTGAAAIGYDTGTDYDALIDIDVSEMEDTNGSVYMRIPFQVESLDALTALRLSMRYDDGFIAYINGDAVASANAPGNPVWDSTSSSNHSDSAAQSFESFDITEHTSLLRQGTNILAIHGMNTSIGSSDMLISPRLESISTTGGSDILLTEGVITVKGRVRDGNEWSALSSATFQVGIAPASADNTVISEIMYHPAEPTAAEIAAGFTDQDQFEFIEIRNTSTTSIDLGEAAFTEGVRYTFPIATVLAPDQTVIIASDVTAFSERYGESTLLSGAYEGNLANSGERLRLADAEGDTIADFSFNDRGNWPRLPDGEGYSLTSISNVPASAASEATNWRSSSTVNGSPGSIDTLRLATWQSTHFTAEELVNPAISDNDADPDNDGLGNLAEYATGKNPRVRDRTSPLTIETETVEEGLRVWLVLQQSIAADDIRTTAQFSTDLENWTDLGAELLDLDNESVPDTATPGIITRQWEIGSLPLTESMLHFRFQFSVREP